MEGVMDILTKENTVSSAGCNQFGVDLSMTTAEDVGGPQNFNGSGGFLFFSGLPIKPSPGSPKGTGENALKSKTGSRCSFTGTMPALSPPGQCPNSFS